MRMILPTEGKPGEGLDDDERCLHCAQHAAEMERSGDPDYKPTEAERLRIQRGRQLLRNEDLA